MKEAKRHEILSTVVAYLNNVVAGSNDGHPLDKDMNALYILGGYTVLRMLGIATDDEYDELVEQLDY